MNFELLAELLFPNVTDTPEDMEAKYPPRAIAEDACVTRLAPSPTGFMHFGTLFPALVCERLAHRSGGIFYLRIEDTDAKREVEGAEKNLIETLAYYKIFFDEGARADGEELGDYGPYKQSHRASIYHVYAKKLVKEGKAYPCFCSAEELDAMRAEQEAEKATPGYRRGWSKCRELDIEEVSRRISEKSPYVLRLRSEGDIANKTAVTDLVKGKLELPENDEDFVLLKSDGIPTYHFAHAVDDHLMRTTHVIRGEEWLPSLPKHIQLFRYLGFKAPKYLHIAQLMKLDGGSKKKLSKRDKGAAVSDYRVTGYAPESVTEYVMTLLNSNYEDWRRANPDASYTEFPFSVKKMSASGCLFDFDKLNDVSKNTVSRMSADQVYEGAAEWADEFEPELAALMRNDPEYAKRIFSIGRGGKKPRKDLTVWGDVKAYIGFFYDSLFEIVDSYPDGHKAEDIAAVLESYRDAYSPNSDQTAWFDGIKAIAESSGYCPDMKAYKESPEKFKGSVADVSMFIRIALTGKLNSPDMYEVMQILGEDRVKARITAMIDRLKK